MKSMTGYGKGTAANEIAEITAEVRSLNSKALKVRFSIPRIFNPLINQLNSLVASFVKRGDVELHVKYRTSPAFQVPVTVNYSEGLAYIKAAKRLGALSGREITVSLRDLLSIPEVFQKEELDAEPFKEPLLKAVEEALLELDRARLSEGEKLKAFFEEHLSVIEKTVEELEREVSTIEEKLFQKLKEKVKKLLEGEELGEEFEKRIELEVALLAEKQDVSEEISRLKAHLKRFREIMEIENEPIGKTLDFLCQEMHREINTLGNKVKEIDVTDPVIRVKTEIARIKEQVQNVE